MPRFITIRLLRAAREYHCNHECVGDSYARGARGATRPTTSAVKVGRVAPRAPVVGHRWYLRGPVAEIAGRSNTPPMLAIQKK